MRTTEIKTFGMHLRSLRKESEMTLKEVSEKVGIDASLLAKIERSKRQPTKLFIKKVATFFDVSEKELLIEFISDQIAYKILNGEVDVNIIKVAESKASYLKSIKNEPNN